MLLQASQSVYILVLLSWSCLVRKINQISIFSNVNFDNITFNIYTHCVCNSCPNLTPIKVMVTQVCSHCTSAKSFVQ